MEVERKIKVFNQADTCKTVKKTYNVEYKELPSQSKTLDITENGNYQVTPDCGYTLNKANINVNITKKNTPTPVVTKESTEQIADYAYWQKECGRAGAKVFLSRNTLIERNPIIDNCLFPLEIGKIIRGNFNMDVVDFTFKVLLKKGTNHVYAIYDNIYKSIDDNCLIKNVEISDCTVTLSDMPYKYNVFGNYVENIEIEAKEDGIYNGTLTVYNYNEHNPINRIRLCKPVCAVLYNLEFPVYEIYNNLPLIQDKINYKNVILYTTNPQSFDWKFKKVDPTLGIKLKYHNTFIYHGDIAEFYRTRLKDRVNSIIHKTVFKKCILHLNTESSISTEFNLWLNSIFLDQSNLCIEMLCDVTKSYPEYNDENDKCIKTKIGKKHEYIKNYNKVLDHLHVANDVITYINRKINFNNYNHRSNQAKDTFFIKIRISKNVNSFKKWYYYRIPCTYYENKNEIKMLKGIIFEKIEYSTEEHF